VAKYATIYSFSASDTLIKSHPKDLSYIKIISNLSFFQQPTIKIKRYLT